MRTSWRKKLCWIFIKRSIEIPVRIYPKRKTKNIKGSQVALLPGPHTHTPGYIIIWNGPIDLEKQKKKHNQRRRLRWLCFFGGWLCFFSPPVTIFYPPSGVPVLFRCDFQQAWIRFPDISVLRKKSFCGLTHYISRVCVWGPGSSATCEPLEIFGMFFILLCKKDSRKLRKNMLFSILLEISKLGAVGKKTEKIIAKKL